MKRQFRVGEYLFELYRLRRLAIIWGQRIYVLVNSNAGHRSNVLGNYQDRKERSGDKNAQCQQACHVRQTGCFAWVNILVGRDLDEPVRSSCQESADMPEIIDHLVQREAENEDESDIDQ